MTLKGNNRYLFRHIKNELKSGSTDTDYVVFLDMVPDNPQAILEYGARYKCTQPSNPEEVAEHNKIKGAFYRGDCDKDCTKQEEGYVELCSGSTVEDRAKLLVHQYPVIPTGSSNKVYSEYASEQITFEQLIELNKKLVKQFNEWALAFKKVDTRVNIEYEKIDEFVYNEK